MVATVVVFRRTPDESLPLPLSRFGSTSSRLFTELNLRRADSSAQRTETLNLIHGARYLRLDVSNQATHWPRAIRTPKASVRFALQVCQEGLPTKAYPKIASSVLLHMHLSMMMYRAPSMVFCRERSGGSLLTLR
jgi:hypothetical protein